jgi:hypothetical protein
MSCELRVLNKKNEHTTNKDALLKTHYSKHTTIKRNGKPAEQ